MLKEVERTLKVPFSKVLAVIDVYEKHAKRTPAGVTYGLKSVTGAIKTAEALELTPMVKAALGFVFSPHLDDEVSRTPRAQREVNRTVRRLDLPTGAF